MAKLAIIGHATRGKEVIEILEMLGGNNPCEYVADSDCFCFYIGNETRNIYYDWFYNFEGKDVNIFTLEEFLEKFPYKVGDKVQYKGATSCGSVYKIENLRWNDNQVEYIVCVFGNGARLTFTAEDLRPFEEEITIDDFKANTKEWLIDKLHDMIISKAIKTIGDIHEELHKPQYPKTYAECCEVLSLGKDGRLYTEGYKASLIQDFQKLIICRNAYWKIAGDWKEKRKDKAIHYVICSTLLGEVVKDTMPNCIANYLLDFPTAEMRDAFYENFKDLIEYVKELL